MTDNMSVMDGTAAVPPAAQPAPAIDAPPATWEDVFKHPRFKELQKAAKDAQAALEAQRQEQEQAEQDKLAEQQQFQALWQKAQERTKELESELAAATAKAQQQQREAAIKEAARSHEPPFLTEALPDLLRLIDLDGFDPEGDLDKQAAGMVAAFAKSRPWLLQSPRSDPGSPPGRKLAGPSKVSGTGKPMGL